MPSSSMSRAIMPAGGSGSPGSIQLEAVCEIVLPLLRFTTNRARISCLAASGMIMPISRRIWRRSRAISRLSSKSGALDQPRGSSYSTRAARTKSGSRSDLTETRNLRLRPASGCPRGVSSTWIGRDGSHRVTAGSAGGGGRDPPLNASCRHNTIINNRLDATWQGLLVTVCAGRVRVTKKLLRPLAKSL